MRQWSPGSGVRRPVVAGSFYPAEPARLESLVRRLLAAAPTTTTVIRPRLLIVPHAGYVYSGSVAAAAYAVVQATPGGIERVLVLGPSHFVGFAGLATAGIGAFATPLGEVPVDPELSARIEAIRRVRRGSEAHDREHSLEVQLPFLQVVLPGTTVVPVLTGDADPVPAAAVVDEALCSEDAIVVVSSDLSHYLDIAAARKADARTAEAIERLQPDAIDPPDACGGTAIRGALAVARRRGWSCRLLDLRNSGDTAGSPERVVGYGAFVLGPVE